MRRVTNSIIAVFFLMSLTIPTFTINTQEGKISTAENRYLASFPDFKDADGKISNTFLSDIQNWFNDNIGFRDDFIRSSQWINYKLLHRSPVSKVTIGKDGWYFFTEFSNLEIATGKYPLSDDDLKNIYEQQRDIKKYLNSIGADYLLVLSPSKPGVYPEKLPFDTASEVNIVTPGEVLEEYLNSNGFGDVMALRKALIDRKKEGRQVFFATDTHWNDSGAYAAYETIMSELNSKGLIEKREVSLSWNESDGYRDLTNMMGIVNFTEPEKYLVASIDSPQAVSVISLADNAELVDKAKAFGASNVKWYQNNSNVNGPRVLIYGDSMFEGFQIVELFAESTSEVLYIQSYDMKQEIVNEFKPDIVIYEMIERSMSALPYQNQDFNSLSIDEAALDKIDTDKVSDNDEINDTADNTDDQDKLSGFIKIEENCIYSIDSINGNGPGDITVSSGDEVEIVGWMADASLKSTYNHAYIKIQDYYFDMNRLERLDVGQFYNNIDLNNCGYVGKFTIPELGKGQYSFSLIFVINDKEYYEETPSFFINVMKDESVE